MNRAIETVAERAAGRARARMIERGAAAIADAFPELTITTEEDAIVLAGRGLARRWLRDARLRWIGRLVL